MSTIELASPRIIALVERGKSYSLTLSRITRQQWLKYFEGIASTSENQGGQRVNSFDATSGLVDLVEGSLIDASGYSVAGGGDLASLKGWQQLIPMRHRLTAGETLTRVEVADPADDEAITLGAESVYLNAPWSAATATSMMLQHNNLCHVFKSPTAEHQRRMSRDASRSKIVGGSRKGKTMWLGARATLVDLYDELILSVGGYSVNGKPLGSDNAAIVAEMDTFHKMAAADALFSPASANLEDEEK